MFAGSVYVSVRTAEPVRRRKTEWIYRWLAIYDSG